MCRAAAACGCTVVVEYDLSNGGKLVVEYKQVGFVLEVSSYRLEVGNDFS